MKRDMKRYEKIYEIDMKRDKKIRKSSILKVFQQGSISRFLCLDSADEDCSLPEILCLLFQKYAKNKTKQTKETVLYFQRSCRMYFVKITTKVLRW